VSGFSRTQSAPGIASLVLDLRTGKTLSIEHPAIVDRPVLPGSVTKVAAIAAALESGTIDDRTRVVCTGTVTVDGHRLVCTHPDLHRPLTAAEALTHSCNVYVATVSARLPRAALDSALAALGLPGSSPRASVQASALGLEGSRTPVRSWIEAIRRIADGSSSLAWKKSTVEIVRTGLRHAAQEGTAAALGDGGIDALAKTGTVDAGGASQGIVVGVMPSGKPTVGFALVVAGGAGRDAAELIVPRLRAAQTVARSEGRTMSASSADSSRVETVRVGIARRRGGYDLRDVPLEEYVSGVVAGEVSPGSAPATLEALAIAARTYVLANRGRHSRDGFDVCDLTHCQVLRPRTATSTAAAERTGGRYLVDRGRPADVYYTASCGGRSERLSSVWPGSSDLPYLQSHEDDACDGAPQWQSEISAGDLLRALRSGGFRGDSIRDVTVARRTPSGRAGWLRVDGLVPAEISGDNLRSLVGRTLGWQHVRSTLFEVTRTGAGYQFSGRGAGHGVGLCVLGAVARGRSGESADTILRAYYPGLTLATLGSPNVVTTSRLRVVLPQQDEPSRADIEKAASRALQQVSVALEVTPAAVVALRFHPTVESYQRETSMPWYTAGSTRGQTIDLLPFSVLRERGLLESTLRHELAHVLTADALNGAPRWMHEGVATWACQQSVSPSLPGSAPTPATTSCPTDAEIVESTSADALRRVYTAAARCYAHEVAQGRSWKTWVPRTK
jgi:stage II sporulation protein D